MQRILIVDDERVIRELLAEILQEEGYRVLQATDGAQAVEVARSERPDLILIDLMMPVRNGVEAIRILKDDSSTRGIPIVAMSAGGNLLREGLLADGLLAKPFDIDTLLAKISMHLRSGVGSKQSIPDGLGQSATHSCQPWGSRVGNQPFAGQVPADLPS